jgi:HTH-type transcriptional regulator, competence development regulator
MSMQKVETFGEMLRKLRETNEMPLRKLAALLDLDQSTLSKIERNERNANADLIEKVAKIFKVSKKDLQVNFLSDKVAYELLEEEFGVEALQVAEEKIKYLRKTNGNT